MLAFLASGINQANRTKIMEKKTKSFNATLFHITEVESAVFISLNMRKDRILTTKDLSKRCAKMKATEKHVVKITECNDIPLFSSCYSRIGLF